jgi:large subunit ribosomal protein L17
MAASLFEHGAIRTTAAKAKELRGFVEKLITLAKKGTLHARRLVIARLQDRAIWTLDATKRDYERADKTVVQKLFSEIAPKYADRPGGYTRIIRLAERRLGDAGPQVILQLVEERKATQEGGKAAGGSRRRRRAAKRRQAVDEAGAAADQTPAERLPDQPADDAGQEKKDP